VDIIARAQRSSAIDVGDVRSRNDTGQQGTIGSLLACDEQRYPENYSTFAQIT
jgi:hypothetical protein